MKIPHKKPIFSEKRTPIISITALITLVLVIVGLLVLRSIFTGEIQPLQLSTPTATRTANSYLEEGQAYFETGNLNSAIEAYQDALLVDPENVSVLTELARIQTYSSTLLTDQRKSERLQQALDNIDRAVEIDEFNSNAHAVRTLVLNWNASAAGTLEERETYLAEASQAAVRAVQLDNGNALAIAYRAEVLADQLQLTQARQLSELAISIEPNSMDTHRVYAYIMESYGNYSQAIEEYKIASSIMPNLTFLYISIGQNYRQLQLYDQALDYFDKAATINETLQIEDPLPYVAIAKTYSRMGEFFIAARNAQRALDFDPNNPDLYGQLGVVFFRSRNYEGSIPVLKCAVEGCTAEENEEQEIDVIGLPLDNNSVVYYYTYGSVLAALNECDRALDILEQVESIYSADETIMSIVQESTFICQSLESGQPIELPSATPSKETTDEGDMMEETPEQ